MTKISFSKIEAYNRCPLEYRLHYVDKAHVKKETKEVVKKANHGEKRASSRLLGKMFDMALTEGMDKAKEYFFRSVSRSDANITELMLVEFFVNKIKATLPDGQSGVSLPTDGKVQGDIDYLSEPGDVRLDIKYTADPYQFLDPQKTLQLMLYASELPQKPETIGFLMVPHICLKRQPGEDIHSYRLRLLEAAAEKGLSVRYVEYDQVIVDKFWADAKRIEEDTEYIPTPGTHCARCIFRGVCGHSHDIPVIPECP